MSLLTRRSVLIGAVAACAVPAKALSLPLPVANSFPRVIKREPLKALILPRFFGLEVGRARNKAHPRSARASDIVDAPHELRRFVEKYSNHIIFSECSALGGIGLAEIVIHWGVHQSVEPYTQWWLRNSLFLRQRPNCKWIELSEQEWNA